MLISSVRHLSCNNRVRFNRDKYGTEEYFSENSVHEAVFKPPWRNCQARSAEIGWGGPNATTRMIATGAAGNIRAAMADLEMWLG